MMDLQTLKIVSYNGHDLETDYTATFPVGSEIYPDVEIVDVQIAEEHPVYGGKVLSGRIWPVQIYLGASGSLAELMDWLDPDDMELRTLVVEDTADSDRQWYLMATVKGMPSGKGKSVLVNMYVADPIWRTVEPESEEWLVTASGDTETFAVLGNRKAHPRLEITPTGVRSGSYEHKAFILIYNRIARAMPRYYLDISGQTGDAWDTAALVGANKLLPSGDDARVYIDGLEVSRWLTEIDDDDTGVHLAISYSAACTLTLGVAIADSGAVPIITMQKTPVNLAALKRLAAAPNKVLAIKTGAAHEIFTFTAVDLVNFRFTGCAREQKDATTFPAIAHSVADVIYWVEHDIWMLYGNPAAAAPDLDASREPMQDKSNSNNDSWVYANFYDEDYARPGAWSGAVLKTLGKLSGVYTANHAGEASPASEMGMRMLAYMLANSWRAETAQIAWSLYQPAGVTAVSTSGEKYRAKNDFPGSAYLQKSLNGVVYVPVWNEAKPATALTWIAFSHAAASLAGTYFYLRYYFYGSLAAIADNEADMEVDDITLALNSANIPVIVFGAEQDNYHMLARITNNETGEWIEFDYPMGVDRTLTIDCDEMTCVYDDGSVVALKKSGMRTNWLDMAGDTELQFDDTGTGHVTINVSWEHRNS